LQNTHTCCTLCKLKQESPAVADKPVRRKSMPKIAPIRCAARWITRKFDHTSSVSSVSALLHQLYLEPLEERRRISRLTFLYTVLHKLVAVSPNHLDLILADRPARGTVTKQRLKILRCSTSQFQKSFVPRTVTQWNTLLDSITSAASVSAFRSQMSSVTRP